MSAWPTCRTFRRLEGRCGSHWWIRLHSGALAPRQPCRIRPCARPSKARCVWPSAFSGTSTGFARQLAPARLPHTRHGRSGGWATTPCTARCANGMATVPGPSGRQRCATGSQRPLSRHVASWSRRFCSINTSNGSPTRSGKRPASNWVRSGSSATFRSWSAPTAPTSGPTSTRSASIAPWAPPRMRSAQSGRTGASRSIDGT